MYFCTHGGSRTHNLIRLKDAPLPVGLREHVCLSISPSLDTEGVSLIGSMPPDFSKASPIFQDRLY